MSEWLSREYPGVWGRSVKPLGAVPHEQLRALQSQVDFGVIPSIWDVFNWTCVEFMSSGIPVICSTGAGAADLIDDGQNGFLFSADDGRSLALALERVLADTVHARAVGLRGRETIVSQLDPATLCAERLQRALRATAGAARSRPDLWARQFLSPEEGEADFRAVLDQLPLRDIANYALARSWSKLART
jgi:glycogen synthase